MFKRRSFKKNYGKKFHGKRGGRRRTKSIRSTYTNRGGIRM
jgi:hypothetical protein